MSTNTTSTNERVAADVAKAPGQPGVGEQNVSPFASNALPDAAVIAKLANEFFAALPGRTVVRDADVVSEQPRVDSAEVPLAASSGAAVPSAPREGSVHTEVPSPQGPFVAPVVASAMPPRSLTENDFHAIAASLTDFAKLVPRFAEPALPEEPASVNAGPWTNPPTFPTTQEAYSFPGVPVVASAPQTVPPRGFLTEAVVPPVSATAVSPAIPSTVPSIAVANPPQRGSNADGSVQDAGRPDPWAVAPTFPSVREAYSFPSVPGEPLAAIPVTSAASESLSNIWKLPSATTDAPVIHSSALPVARQADANSAHVSDAGPMAVPPAIPSVSEFFSMPGVPGAQSPPGIPVLPSSAPTSPTAKNSLPSEPKPAIPLVVPGVASPVASPPSAPATGSAPVGFQSFEFRPDVVPQLETTKRPLDPRLIRRDFPILEERVHGRQLVWLDNAATTQKPNAVIDRLSYFYRHENSNIHRAAHTLAARATDAYESAREKTRRFLNASSTREIIFVRGTTEGINLFAQAWGRRNVHKDDEIVITWLEHHANIVPWQQLCAEKGARLRVAPVNDRGEIILEEYEKLLTPKTRLVSFSQVSNALGTITPAREMVEMAHRHGAQVVVDGAQAVSHMRADVQALNCDFYVFSGHKVFGPTGIGVVYGKLDVLENMPPWQGGGNMIVDVSFEKTVYQSAPARFEAGTGNIADAVGLGAALDYVEEVGMENISAYEHQLLEYGTAGLLTVPGLKLIGTAREKAGVLSFVLDDLRTEDVGVALNEEGIAVRSGHHCAQPILRRMGVESTVRPSLAFYNTCEELDQLVAALLRIQARRNRR
jgi:cysteine desulfurase / selenocysteine lyase